MLTRLFTHRLLSRFLLPTVAFVFSAVAGVSFAAWLDAPNAPPNYGMVGCTPSPCSQDDFKPMNLGTTAQTKRSGATFEGDLTADSIVADGFFDRQGQTYFIDPKATIASGNLSGTFTVGGNVGIGTTDTSTYALNVAGNANATQLCIAGECKPTWASIIPPETDPKVAGGNPNSLTKWTGAGTLGNSVIYDNGSLIGIGTTNPGVYKLNVAGDTNISGGLVVSGNINVSGSGSNIGVNTAYVRTLCVTDGCMNRLVPRAYPSGSGAWTWTRVVSNTIPDGYSMVWRPGSVILDPTRSVLGLNISGSSDDGGICGAGVNGYFWGWTSNDTGFNNFFPDLYGGGLAGAFVSNAGTAPFAGADFIFESISPGRTFWDDLLDDELALKAAGVTFIPPGKTLFYWQLYNNGQGPGGNTCNVDVLYEN